jgi:hypothetical protein
VALENGWPDPDHVWSAGDVKDRALTEANWPGSSMPSVSGHG